MYFSEILMNHLTGTFALIAAMSCAGGEPTAAGPEYEPETQTTTGSWQETLRQAAFVKEGLGRLYNPHYQFECIGLGGTTMRVGPNGFTKPGAPRVPPGGFLKHEPYLAYEYWWDEEGHRHIPFDLAGGYGERFEPGQITSFRHDAGHPHGTS